MKSAKEILLNQLPRPNHQFKFFINMNKVEEIIKILTEKKSISQKQLTEIQAWTKLDAKSFEEKLIEKAIINSEELTRLKAEQANLRYQILLSKKIDDLALNIIPIEVAENYKIICFEKEKNKIKVGLTDPNDFKAIEAVDFLAKEKRLEVEYYLISRPSLDYVFKHYKTLDKEVTTALQFKAEEEAKKFAKIREEKTIEIEDITKAAPVAKIVSVIIRHAVEGRASDIHIEPMPRESRVRYRIDGILHTSLTLPKNIHSAIVARIKVMANLKLDETRLPQDGRIRINYKDSEIDLRISTLPLIDEEKVVMRILDVTKGAPTLEDLGFTGISLEIIKKNIKKTGGMLLVTGPTGCGKSTTLFSILNMINREGVNTVTLEDPVEYFVKGVNQSQIRPEIGFTFASGLRSLLRQDPNIIMVGEIRDNETAELAIHASLTGHFVLSTLHTNNALGAIPRLLDMKVEPFLLGSTLNAVVAQRLSRKICTACKVEDKLPESLLNEVKEKIKKIPEDVRQQNLPDFNFAKMKFYKGQGCFRCGNTGYVGRLALCEALDVTDEIKEIIMSKDKMLGLDDIIGSQKFITMEQDGMIKVLKGLTSVEEIYRTIYE